MRQPLSITRAPAYPVAAGVGLLAIGVTIAWMAGRSIESLTMNTLHFPREPWRLVTSIFPHAGILHLAFNVYWLWVFGTLVEERLGHLRFLAIVLLLAAASSAAEFAVFEGGVGLSGVGYGLFGLLWVLSAAAERGRGDPAFRGAIDGRTVGLFVMWFFFCIVLTETGAMPIANVAHGAGAVAGAALGWVMVSPKGRRVLPVAAMAALLGVIGAGATVLRTRVNLSEGPVRELAYAGYQELEANHNERAAALLGEASRYRRANGAVWYDLGIAYERLNRLEAAAACFRRATQLEADPKYREALESVEEARKESATAPAGK